MKTLSWVISVLVMIGLFVGAIIFLMGLSLSPIQTGTYEGQTIDYSHQRGIIFQTNDMTTKTNERSSQREDWCVPDNDQALVEKVRSIEQGQEVRIKYHRPLWIWPDTCEGNLKIIDSITVINKTNGGN